MTSQTELQGALTSLSQTLTARADDASHDDVVFPRWFGTKQGCSAVLRRAEDWYALPDQSGAYDDPYAQLVWATNRLAIVQNTGDWLDALGDANSGIAAVNALLNSPVA